MKNVEMRFFDSKIHISLWIVKRYVKMLFCGI